MNAVRWKPSKMNAVRYFFDKYIFSVNFNHVKLIFREIEPCHLLIFSGRSESRMSQYSEETGYVYQSPAPTYPAQASAPPMYGNSYQSGNSGKKWLRHFILNEKKTPLLKFIIWK